MKIFLFKFLSLFFWDFGGIWLYLLILVRFLYLIVKVFIILCYFGGYVCYGIILRR